MYSNLIKLLKSTDLKCGVILVRYDQPRSRPFYVQILSLQFLKSKRVFEIPNCPIAINFIDDLHGLTTISLPLFTTLTSVNGIKKTLSTHNSYKINIVIIQLSFLTYQLLPPSCSLFQYYL